MTEYKPFEKFLEEHEDKLVQKPRQLYVDHKYAHLSDSAKTEILAADMRTEQGECNKRNNWFLKRTKEMYDIFAQHEFPTENMRAYIEGSLGQSLLDPFRTLVSILSEERLGRDLSESDSIARLSRYACGGNGWSIFSSVEKLNKPAIFFYDLESTSRYCTGHCDEEKKMSQFSREGKIITKGLIY